MGWVLGLPLSLRWLHNDSLEEGALVKLVGAHLGEELLMVDIRRKHFMATDNLLEVSWNRLPWKGCL